MNAVVAPVPGHGDARAEFRARVSAGEPLHLAPQTRTIMLDRAALDATTRSIEISFSSETPVERWWGTEVLGHDRAEVDLGFMGSGRAPLLYQHDPNRLIGVVERAWIGSDRKGRAVVRFGKSDIAERALQDVADGILTNVSVGYRIDSMKLIAEDDTGETYRIDRWTPMEASLVSIPADASVGVGRSDTPDRTYPVAITRETKTMTTQAIAEPATPAPVVAATVAAAVLSAEDRSKAIAEAQAGERKRVAEISAIGSKFNKRDLADKAIAEGTPVDFFRGIMLDAVGAEGFQASFQRDHEIGLTPRERRQYSLTRLVRGFMERGLNGKGAEFEIECSQAAAKEYGVMPRGFFVPRDVMFRGLDDLPGLQQRDLVVGTATAGGNLVATELLSQSFIELLRNRMQVKQMGATMLSGLVGNIAIPKQSAAGTAYWVGENAAGTESQQTVAQVTMTPKTVTAFTDFGRQLMLQASLDVEAFVRNDLSKILALAIDLAAIHGTGASNQPTGIAATAGIGSVAGGTNGAAPTWDNVVDLETQVAGSNADLGALGYLTNSKVRGKLKRTQKFASTNGDPVWEVKSSYAPMGEMNGYKAGVSNQVSSGLTKGSSSGICSAVFYGNWADLMIGEWGTLDVTIDPYTGSTAGTVRVVVFQSVDVAVRNAVSFAAMLDALTT